MEVVGLVLVGRLYLSMGTSGLGWIFLSRCLVCFKAFLHVKLSSLFLKMSWFNDFVCVLSSDIALERNVEGDLLLADMGQVCLFGC